MLTFIECNVKAIPAKKNSTFYFNLIYCLITMFHNKFFIYLEKKFIYIF